MSRRECTGKTLALTHWPLLWGCSKIWSSSAPALFRKHRYRYPRLSAAHPKTYLPPIPVGRTCTCAGTPGSPCVPAASPACTIVRRPVRLSSSPDSVATQTGCRGGSTTPRSPGNAPIGSTDSLVAQTHWVTSRGTCRAYVLQNANHTDTNGSTLQLQNRFAGFRIPELQASTRSATSRVRHLPNHWAHGQLQLTFKRYQ